MAGGTAAVDTLATLGTSPQPGQAGLGAGLVQKYQPRRIQAALPSLPDLACPGDVRPVLLAGAEHLFYKRPIQPPLRS